MLRFRGARRAGGRVAAILIAATASATLATTAHAGVWMQVTCDRPSMNSAAHSANTEGWTGFVFGGATFPTYASVSCSFGDPLFAGVVGDTGSGNYGAALQYTPPAGSEIAGGSLVIVDAGNSGATYISQGTMNEDEPFDVCSDSCGPFTFTPSLEPGPLYVIAGCLETCGSSSDDWYHGGRLIVLVSGMILA